MTSKVLISNDTNGGERQRKIWSNWLLTIPFWLLFGGTLLALDPLLRLSRVLKSPYYEKVVILLSKAIVVALRVAGVTVQLDDGSKIAAGPVVVVSNHQSMMDIPLLNLVFQKRLPRFVAKKELGRGIPFVSYHLRHGGHALIDRADARQAVMAISEFGRRITQENLLAVVFPEGTRARSGKLGPFKAAGLVTLLKNCPTAKILPVTIDGAWEFNARNLLPVISGVKMQVLVGDLIPLPPEHELPDLVKKIRIQIESNLQTLRAARTGAAASPAQVAST